MLTDFVDEALNELKVGGSLEKAAVYAMLAMTQALKGLDAIAFCMEERTLHVKAEVSQDR